MNRVELLKAEIYQQLVNFLPGRWFHQLETGETPLFPVLQGVALAIAKLKLSQEAALDAAIPMRASGKWLSLHLQGIGLNRTQKMSDETARTLYQWQFKPTRNTRAGQLMALEKFLGLKPPQIRLEGDRSLGLYGQFRLVIDDENLNWSEVELEFLNEFTDRYIANGIIAGIDVNLKCLKITRFVAYEHFYDFPLTENQLGTVWERPTFLDLTNLPESRNTIAMVTPQEWFRDSNRLHSIHAELNAPGAFFLYMTDEGKCPYLSVNHALTGSLTTGLITTVYVPDGYQHYYDFPYEGALVLGSMVAPFLSINAYPETTSLLEIPLAPISETQNPWVGENIAGDTSGFGYFGVDFTRFEIVETYTIEGQTISPTNPAYLMGVDSWTLTIGRGLPSWGLRPPTSASTAVVDTITTLQPSASWWTDKNGKSKHLTPQLDSETNAVYLAIEFLFQSTDQQDVKELALKRATQTVHYRRFLLNIEKGDVLGLLFLVKGYAN